MSQAANPTTDLVLADPNHPNDTHPMVDLSPNTQPFTLLSEAGPPPYYQWTFINRTNSDARAFLIGFSTSVDNSLWTDTISVAAEGGTSEAAFNASNLNSATHLWVGSWWDDGTYGTDSDGIKAFFRDHPNGSGHHTVPVIVG